MRSAQRVCVRGRTAYFGIIICHVLTHHNRTVDCHSVFTMLAEQHRNTPVSGNGSGENVIQINSLIHATFYLFQVAIKHNICKFSSIPTYRLKSSKDLQILNK